MKFTKKSIYIGLFSVLYLIVAFSSFWHACAFFGLANNSWMSIILAFAFEIGQAAVLFSLLTSKKDRSRVMPWVLMTMFTLVQVIGNVFSSYKYIILNSVENLRYFKEPIFIWTTIPDDQATVIIVYLVGALLPIASLLLTSMITNYLSDQEEIKELEQNEINKKSSKIEEGKQLERIDEETNQEENIEKEDKQKELIQEIPSEDKIDDKTEIKGTDPDGGVIGELGDDASKIFDLPKSELLKPDFIDNNKEIKYNSVDEALAHMHENEGFDDLEKLNQMEDLIKNGINENKKETNKVSHFINQ